MAEEKEKTYCYKHPSRETRISCTECGNYICTKCMVPAPVGQKCPNCVNKGESHITKITPKEYLLSILAGGFVSFLSCLILLRLFNGPILVLVAYLIGFAVYKTISSIIGNKIGFKIQAIAGTLVFIGMLYNPLYMGYGLVKSNFNLWFILAYLQGPMDLLLNFAMNPLGCGKRICFILSVVIGVWASVRHFRL